MTASESALATELTRAGVGGLVRGTNTDHLSRALRGSDTFVFTVTRRQSPRNRPQELGVTPRVQNRVPCGEGPGRVSIPHARAASPLNSVYLQLQ